jgi:hypothetical protein
MFTAIQVAAPVLRVELNPTAVRDAGEIERAVEALARVRRLAIARHNPCRYRRTIRVVADSYRKIWFAAACSVKPVMQRVGTV